MRPPIGSLPWYLERTLMHVGIIFDYDIAYACWLRNRSFIDCARMIAHLARWKRA